jgi:hypothetical protein
VLETYPWLSCLAGHIRFPTQMLGSLLTCQTPRMDLPQRKPNKRLINRETGRAWPYIVRPATASAPHPRRVHRPADSTSFTVLSPTRCIGAGG